MTAKVAVYPVVLVSKEDVEGMGLNIVNEKVIRPAVVSTLREIENAELVFDPVYVLEASLYDDDFKTSSMTGTIHFVTDQKKRGNKNPTSKDVHLIHLLDGELS